MIEHPSPVPLEALAAVLRGRQADLIRPTGQGVDAAQVGAAVLPEPFPVPVPKTGDPVMPRGGEAVIETFMTDGTGPATPLGDDPAVADWWLPSVDALVGRVVEALQPFGVELTGTIFVTASATEVDQVITSPHLDDDQFHPDTGIGVVAIAASHGGPRLARGALRCRSATAGAPLGLDQDLVDTWFDRTGGASPGERTGSVQTAGADQVVLFPRFGQLHAGPGLAERPANAGAPVRNLLVLRAETAPQPRR